jgi:hypothetical protein
MVVQQMLTVLHYKEIPMHLLDNKTQLMLRRQHSTESMHVNALNMSQDRLFVSK